MALLGARTALLGARTALLAELPEGRERGRRSWDSDGSARSADGAPGSAVWTNPSADGASQGVWAVFLRMGWQGEREERCPVGARCLDWRAVRARAFGRSPQILKRLPTSSPVWRKPPPVDSSPATAPTSNASSLLPDARAMRQESEDVLSPSLDLGRLFRLDRRSDPKFLLFVNRPVSPPFTPFCNKIRPWHNGRDNIRGELTKPRSRESNAP